MNDDDDVCAVVVDDVCGDIDTLSCVCVCMLFVQDDRSPLVLTFMTL